MFSVFLGSDWTDDGRYHQQTAWKGRPFENRRDSHKIANIKSESEENVYDVNGEY